jgi:hypothetical protein
MLNRAACGELIVALLSGQAKSEVARVRQRKWKSGKLPPPCVANPSTLSSIILISSFFYSFLLRGASNSQEKVVGAVEGAPESD